MSITEKRAVAPLAAKGTHGVQDVFYIRLLEPEGLVLDVFQNDKADNQQVIAYPLNEGLNQQWEFVPAGAPGWWYLRTKMGTGFVLTLAASGSIVVSRPAEDERDDQLWCLSPTMAPGYWTVQSKSVVSNALDPKVIGISSNTSGGTSGGAPNAVSVTLDYAAFKGQAWAFAPLFKP